MSEILAPSSYFSELRHETRMFDFETKIEKSETNPSEDDFFLENTMILGRK